MHRWSFERMCRESRMQPVHREERSNHLILIADGWFQSQPDRLGPHYQTIWAVGKNDNDMRIARPLYFDGGVGCSTRESRLAAALEDARETADGLDGRGL